MAPNGEGKNGHKENHKKAKGSTEEVTPPGILSRIFRPLFSVLLGLLKVVGVCGSMLWAYRIRLAGIKIYGYQVHGFAPQFNYRAARYLAAHGYYDFFRWFDYMSWYPLGRPVGTTIYPGMQFAAVWIWEAAKLFPKTTMKLPAAILGYLPKSYLSYLPGHGTLAVGPMTLNESCCLTGAWFGASATLFIGLLAAETSESTGAGLVAAFVMAGIPAHLMRSMAGEFDNEAVAMTFFVATFYFWCRSLRTPSSWPWSVLTAVAYVCAVATWGGYIFANNLIGLHAAVLVGLGMYNTGVYRAYSLWYVLGTAGATFVPVVGWTPLRSLEQMPSMAVFVGFQLLELCDVYRRRQKKGMTAGRFFVFRVLVFVVAAAIVAAGCWILMQLNYFSPLSSRIRGLFLQHHKTGNPLVDSVSEHQASNASAYVYYLGTPRFFAAGGLLLCWHQRTPAKVFPVLFAAVAYHFSLKMNRLILICGPIVSMLAGYPFGIVADWCIEQFVRLICGPRAQAEKSLPERTGGMGSIFRTARKMIPIYPSEFTDVAKKKSSFAKSLPFIDRPVRLAVATAILSAIYWYCKAFIPEFVATCEQSAGGFSHPGILQQLQNGGILDDEVVGYQWFKKNTPKEARVMSWWDYGYHITGMGNRTSLADGNTWNHEHIATLGRILSAPEKKSWNIMRHLADYVLVKAGHQETDLRISTHFARIGNSVFPDICGADDPTCNRYGFVQGGQPSQMMKESFVFRAVKHGGQEGIKLNPKLFQEVHSTKYNIIRIFKVLNVSQESKDWVADPANKICDAPGSWYCTGQYPPSLKKLIEKRKNFAQLEDFNKKGQEKSAYTKMIEERQKKAKPGDSDL